MSNRKCRTLPNTMPFVKRKSYPVRISQVGLTKDVTVRDELECISNHAMCCIMQQLSNLAHHATDMFDDLSSEAKQILNRTEKLRNHVNELKEKYKKFNKRKPGECSNIMDNKKEKTLSQRFDQQILGPNTRPVAITSMYDMANPPPCFKEVNQYRDDGKDGLTLYTDPTYFFVYWSSQMQQKQTEHGEKQKRERKARRQDGKSGPRQVKRRQDQLVQRAKGIEYDPNFNRNEQDQRKRKKKKKKKMDGFSNRQWEKQHPNQRLDKLEESHEVNTEDQGHLATNGEVPCTSADLKEENNNETKEEDTPPPVPMRKQVSVSEERDSIPPPPPPLDENNEQNCPRQSVAFPPTPYEFYQQNEGRNSELLPPPPLLDESDNSEQDFRDSLLPPPPPRESEVIEPRKTLKSQRISTFILPPPIENNDSSDGRQSTPPPDYPMIDETPENVVPVAPKTPPAPPPPPPPPPPMSSTSTTDRSTEKHKTDEVTLVQDADSTPQGGLFDSNSLLAIKKNLKQSKERKVEPVKSKQNNFDVHSIMTKALDSHRKFIEDSSSEEDSEEYDSDSDWD